MLTGNAEVAAVVLRGRDDLGEVGGGKVEVPDTDVGVGVGGATGLHAETVERADAEEGTAGGIEQGEVGVPGGGTVLVPVGGDATPDAGSVGVEDELPLILLALAADYAGEG